MSDPVSKAEIEDVLSSIRRLVSEDVAPSSTATEWEVPPEKSESKTDRLVLTPAFRVRVNEEDGDTSRPKPAVSAEPFRLEQKSPDKSEIPAIPVSGETSDNGAAKEVDEDIYVLSDQPLVTGAKVAGEEGDIDGSENHPEHALENPDGSSDDDNDQPGTGDASDLNFSELAGAPISAFETALSPEDVPEFRALEDRVAHMEAAVSAQNLDWEPDGSEVDEETPDKFPGKYAFSSSRGDTASADEVKDDQPTELAGVEEWKNDLIAQNISSVTFLHKRSSEVAGEGAFDYSDQDQDPKPATDTLADEDVETQLQELADTLGDAEPEATSDNPVFVRAGSGAADANQDFTAEAESEPVTEGFEFVRNSFRDPAENNRDDDVSGPDLAEGPETADFNDDLLLDEASLRNLIADVVREELKGDFGERITRNVRKMVRREVMRALATRDSD